MLFKAKRRLTQPYDIPSRLALTNVMQNGAADEEVFWTTAAEGLRKWFRKKYIICVMRTNESAHSFSHRLSSFQPVHFSKCWTDISIFILACVEILVSIAMSAVEHYLNKNYGQYVLILESELGNSNITSGEQCVLYSNIAIAQLRKCYSTFRPRFVLIVLV